MYNSILQKLEELAKKICERSYFGEITDLDLMAADVLADCKEVSTEIIEVIIETMNREFREDKPFRKEQGLIIKEKDRPRELLTALGTIHYERDYYFDNRAEQYTIPVDQMLGVRRYERIGGSVCAELVASAAEQSYAKAANAVTGGRVSRQTVHDKILKVTVPEMEPAEEKKQVQELHVYADEDHAHEQKAHKKKGKQGIIIPLVTVTEGTRKVSEGRNETINAMHFSDEGFHSAGVWKSAEGYIAAAYDMETLEKIYVHGDGGAWIMNGLDVFSQTRHIMDGYHFFKELKKICRIFPDRNVKIALLNSLGKNDRKKADAFIQELLKELSDRSQEAKLTEKQCEKTEKFAGYLFRHWDPIRRLVIEDVPGSCTEAQIGHVLSERFSRDPMGWSRPVLGKLVGIRLYLKNGGSLTKAVFQEGELKTERYRDLADRFIAEHLRGAVDFSLFEAERPIFDGFSGTQIWIHGLSATRNMLA